MPWFSVKESKPDSSRYVLLSLTILFPEAKIGFYKDNRFYVPYPDGQKEDVTKWVTLWHELPQPPKE